MLLKSQNPNPIQIHVRKNYHGMKKLQPCWILHICSRMSSKKCRKTVPVGKRWRTATIRKLKKRCISGIQLKFRLIYNKPSKKKETSKKPNKTFTTTRFQTGAASANTVVTGLQPASNINFVGALYSNSYICFAARPG